MGAELKVGLIGAGAAAQVLHAPAFRACPRAELVGVYSRTSERAETLGLPRVYDTLDALLGDDEIDAVSICTPPHVHRAIAEAAVAAAKHVLIEKPVAHTITDVEALCTLGLDARPLILEIVRNERYMDLHQAAKAAIDDGRIGEVRTILAFTSTTGPDAWTGGAAWPKRLDEAGGGALLDLGVHKVDLMQWLIGQEAIRIHDPALLRPGRDKGDVEWLGTVTLEFAGGATGTVSASWLGPADTMLVLVAGSEGILEANGVTGELSILRKDSEPTCDRRVVPWSDDDRSSAAMVAAFVDSCLDGRLPDPFDALIWGNSTRWILEAYERA